MSATTGSTLAPAARRTLAALAGSPLAERFYLAGSAAIAEHLAHRPVAGLDLMSELDRLTPAERRDRLQEVLARDPDARVETARDGFLHLRTGEGVSLKLFYYPYPRVGPDGEAEGFPVASPLDLTLMKLGAVISRGTRADFVDLFLLAREVPLADALAASAAKFPHVRDFPLQALKALADLELAEADPMPPLELSVDWEEVAAWALASARNLGRRRVGLP